LLNQSPLVENLTGCYPIDVFNLTLSLFHKKERIMSKGSESYVFLSFASALFNQNFAAMVPMKSSILKFKIGCAAYIL
jgi:hypothetical protein